MTDQEINRAIAEWCGLEKTTKCDECYGTGFGASESDRCPCYACSSTGKVAEHFKVLPNYTEDLNACRDAEKFSINVSNIEEHKIALCSVCGCDEKSDIYSNTDALLFATARQRCEALLRVLGKWKE